MPADSKPNIVYILHDNTGWGDWGVYGGTTATPRIDELAAQGEAKLADWELHHHHAG